MSTGNQDLPNSHNHGTPFSRNVLRQQHPVQTARPRPITRPRHPEYVDKAQRLASFTFWRFEHVQDPFKLAELGFFYTKEADLVRCHFCSLGLKDFISSDDPLLEHVRYSGECEFLVQYLGPGRLREIQNGLRAEALPVYQRGDQAPIHNEHSAGGGAPGQGESRRSNTQQLQHSHPPNHKSTHKNYRHPEYSAYQVRLASFTGWPHHMVQTPALLAEAGFYYTGSKDVVRCFACDGGLEKWAPTDDPWIEHCINFPTCVHLIETKGQEYITLALHYQKQQRPSAASATNAQEITNGLNGIHISQFNTERSDDIKSIVQITLDMGFSREDIERVVDKLKRDKQEVTVETIIDNIQTKTSEVTNSSTLNSKDLLEEHRRLKEELYCMRCKTADINVLFLPCQHHRVCSGCADSLNNCLVCGRRITQRIKTYRP